GSRVAGLEYYLWKRGRIRWVGLPNILADRTICPELLGPAARPEAFVETVMPWLVDPASAEPMRQELRAVKQLLGSPGGAGRTAELALALAASTRSCTRPRSSPSSSGGAPSFSSWEPSRC